MFWVDGQWFARIQFFSLKVDLFLPKKIWRVSSHFFVWFSLMGCEFLVFLEFGIFTSGDRRAAGRAGLPASLDLLLCSTTVARHRRHLSLAGQQRGTSTGGGVDMGCHPIS